MSDAEKPQSLLTETWSELNIRSNPTMYIGAVAGGGTGLVVAELMQPESTTEYAMSVDGTGSMSEVGHEATISGFEGFVGGALIGAVALVAAKSWMKRRAERSETPQAA